ncbi:MAG: FliM/FliN family flagellar motor switch protein [Candidatus Gastranaerophilales bacterium]|nr:FliM/FliN family flagellar motor switch protein [Candidatus Gastranaerophilales bacterium]
MPLTAIKQTSNEDIKKYFEWFENEFSNLLKTTVEEFWNTSLNIKLFSLELNENNFSSGNEYFVTQAEVHSLTYSFKISDSACEILLEKTLGENGKKYFDLSSITELEGTIISKFANKFFVNLKPLILTPKEIKKNIEDEEVFEDYLNFGFVLKDGNEKYDIGKIYLKLPLKVIKLPELEEKEGKIDTTKFRRAKTLVDIFIGKTRLSLDDINNIETEDIVVLEKSNIKKMSVIYPTKIDFAVNPDPRLFMDDEDNDINKEDTGVSTKDIWDNVQVDVCAKFPKVKMSLGELRDMTEGVVMELDSIYGNEVMLEVENRNVAKGELIIVGSKYGVKVTEIFSQDEIASNEKQQQEASDDFDVKDFEIEE